MPQTLLLFLDKCTLFWYSTCVCSLSKCLYIKQWYEMRIELFPNQRWRSVCAPGLLIQLFREKLMIPRHFHTGNFFWLVVSVVAHMPRKKTYTTYNNDGYVKFWIDPSAAAGYFWDISIDRKNPFHKSNHDSHFTTKNDDSRPFFKVILLLQ